MNGSQGNSRRWRGRGTLSSDVDMHLCMPVYRRGTDKKPEARPPSFVPPAVAGDIHVNLNGRSSRQRHCRRSEIRSYLRAARSSCFAAVREVDIPLFFFFFFFFLVRCIEFEGSLKKRIYLIARYCKKNLRWHLINQARLNQVMFLDDLCRVIFSINLVLILMCLSVFNSLLCVIDRLERQTNYLTQ